MKDYIFSQKAITVEYISNCPIYELFTGAKQIPGLIRFMWWWYKDHTQEEEFDGTSEGVEREEG